MSTPPVPPGRPEDLDDPTGVRALLAGLGDPGPMPADLVDRINASIAAEQRARVGHTSAGHAASENTFADAHGTVVPLRRRLPSWPKIGLAAAAVAAVAVAVPAMAGTGPGELLASLSGTGSNSASSAGSAAKASPEAGRKDAGEHAMSSAATVTLKATGTSYTSSGLRTQARTVLAGAVEDHATPSSALSGARAGVASADEAGLRECLTALGVAASMPLTGDVATYDGRPAVVVVVSGATGQSVYAVAPDCDADHPAVMAGPVPLG